MDQSLINFALYEDGTEYMGIAKATLPDLNFLTQVISGAGMSGNLEAVIVGHLDTMTLGLEFRTTTTQAIKLVEPRRHQIDMRVAQQAENAVSGNLEISGVKHVFVVMPKGFKAGTVAPASSADSSGEYAVRYWATYTDGKKTLELDPLNFICNINGTDYLAEVRKVLGK
jgi:hypothetical protein